MTLHTPDWEPEWKPWEDILREAYIHSLNSVDPSTQNAAVIVDAIAGNPGGGFILDGTWATNSLPYGVTETPERWERPLKYSVVEHAERNSIYRAARHGIATGGHAMVCPWEPCTDCARAVIQAGIHTLVTHSGMNAHTPDSWAESIALARGMLTEAGVLVLDIDGFLDAPGVRHTGEIWFP